MFGGFRAWLTAACITLMAVQPAWAAKPTFDELLDRVQSEEAAGHILSPPDDNMTATMILLLDLLPSATPDQLSRLNEMLERSKQAMQTEAQSPPTDGTSPSGAPDPTAAVASKPSAMPPMAKLIPGPSVTALSVPAPTTQAKAAPVAPEHNSSKTRPHRHHSAGCSSHNHHGHCN
jgi:hypothetical protein